MPIPVEYQRATDHFHQFLSDARDAADLETVHQAYTMTQGVLQAFRRRLEIAGRNPLFKRAARGHTSAICGRLGSGRAEAAV